MNVEAATEARDSVLRCRGNKAGIRPPGVVGACGRGVLRSFMAVYILSTSAIPGARWWLEKDSLRPIVADCLGAQLTPSFVAGELSWKDWSEVWKPGEPEWWRVRWPLGPLGRVPWEKAAFCRLCGMWVGERGAEPE